MLYFLESKADDIPVSYLKKNPVNHSVYRRKKIAGSILVI